MQFTRLRRHVPSDAYEQQLAARSYDAEEKERRQLERQQEMEARRQAREAQDRDLVAPPDFKEVPAGPRFERFQLLALRGTQEHRLPVVSLPPRELLGFRMATRQMLDEPEAPKPQKPKEPKHKAKLRASEADSEPEQEERTRGELPARSSEAYDASIRARDFGEETKVHRAEHRRRGAARRAASRGPRQAERAEAEAQQKYAVAAAHNKNSLSTLAALRDWADACLDFGLLFQAERLHHRVYTGHLGLLHPEHADACAALRAWVQTLRLLGRQDEADEAEQHLPSPCLARSEPVPPPPSQPPPGKKAIALFDFDGGRYGPEYLSLREGDSLDDLGTEDAGWLYGYSHRLHRGGWYPPGYAQCE